jgi:hypothetical protein
VVFIVSGAAPAFVPPPPQIRMQDDDSHPGGVYKGPHGDVAQAYIVSAPFELVEADKVGGPSSSSSSSSRSSSSSSNSATQLTAWPQQRVSYSTQHQPLFAWCTLALSPVTSHAIVGCVAAPRPQVGEAAGEAKPIGINGQHVIMGEYSQVADNPQRLTVTFKSECRTLHN